MSHTGHRQVRTDIPSPLQSGSVLQQLGTTGLPSSVISSLSLVATLVTLALVQRSPELRSDYHPAWLSPDLAIPVALGCAALAWTIAFICKSRPGRLWPRYWALILAMLATLAAVFTLVKPDWLPAAQINALAIAALAGTLALTPRLARLHPHSAWTQHIAPVTLIAVLCLLISLSFPGANSQPTERLQVASTQTDDTTGDANTAKSAAIVATREAKQNFIAANSFDWSRFGNDYPGAVTQVDRLANLHDSLSRLPQAWSEIAEVDQAGLADAAAQLMQAVVNAIDPDRENGLPSLATLGLAPRKFAAHAKVVYDYFATIGSLLEALQPVTDDPASAGLAAAYRHAQETLATHLEQIQGRWPDAWVTAAMPAALRSDFRLESSLAELLRSELFEFRGQSYHANQIDALWGIDKDQAQRLQPNNRNACGGRRGGSGNNYRIDCYAFAASAAGTKIRLAAELRLVYPARKPRELWYAVPIPDDLGGSERQHFRDDLFATFLGAVQQAGLDVDSNGAQTKVTANTASPSKASPGRASPGRASQGPWLVLSGTKQKYLDGRNWVFIRVVEIR